jgi:hypothetical protein
MPLKRKWWAFQAHRPELYKRLTLMQRVLVTSQVNPRFGFSLMPANWIFSHKAVVFCIESHSGFGMIQSRIHESWARAFSSTSLELMSYTPSDCFETFPFPRHWEANAALEAAGRAYHEYRAALMSARDEGITKTYNHFHDRSEQSDDTRRLRDLHAAMDRAVLEGYRWRDLAERAAPVSLDETNEDDHTYQGRLFWPSAFRNEVLARLLALNAERAEAERAAGVAPVLDGEDGVDEAEELDAS